MPIEPILLYDSETWILTTRQQKRLDGTLATCPDIQNIHWSEQATLESINGDIPPLSQKLRRRRLCWPLTLGCWRVDTIPAAVEA